MASAATFVAYIDEAGDEGFKFGKGSSEWFVLGAAILRRATEMPKIKLIDDVRLLLPCAYRHSGELFGHGPAFVRWEKQGIFDILWAILLTKCDELQGVDWHWQAADGCLGKARGVPGSGLGNLEAASEKGGSGRMRRCQSL